MSESSSCPRCSAPFDPSRAQYDDEGTLVCSRCAAQRLIASTKTKTLEEEKTTTSSLFPGALGMLVLAFSSFCLRARGIFFLLPVIAIGASFLIVMQTIQSGDSKEVLGRRYYPTIVIASIAGIVGVLALLVTIAYPE